MTQPRSTSRRNGVVVAAVLGVLVVVGGLVLVQVLTSGDGDPADAAGPRQVETPAAGECNEPPPVPESPEQYDEVPDASTAEGAVWTARMATNCGEIVMELYGDKAPQAVSSFIFLAREGFWYDSPCSRLTTSGIFVLQCGDPTGTGSGGPGYVYGVENAPADDSYPRGALAMARTQDPNSNGSQFFIVYDDTQLPDPTGYSIFGKVTKGMGIVDRIAKAGVGGSLGPEAPAQPISILDIQVEKAS